MRKTRVTFESLRQYITMNFDGLKDDVVSLLSDVPVKVNSLRFSNDMHRVECKDDQGSNLRYEYARLADLPTESFAHYLDLQARHHW